MWKIIREHFERYANPLTEDEFGFMPNLINTRTSINFTLLGFPISAYSYDDSGKKKVDLVYIITEKKTKYGTDKNSYDEKKFFKLLKSLEKQKYLFYITSYSEEKLTLDNFRNNTVKDNFKLGLDYSITEDIALHLNQKENLKSTNKTAPKFIYGVSKTGKLKTLYKANKKICNSADYWQALKKGD